MADNKITFEISLDGIQDAEQSITSIGKAASKASETARSAFNGAEESIAKIVARSRQASDAEIFLGQSIAKSAKTAQAEFDVLNKSISEIAGQSRNAEQSVSSIGTGADKARMSISQLAGQSQKAIGVLNRLGGINPVFSDAAVSITQVNTAFRTTQMLANGFKLADVFSPISIAAVAAGALLTVLKTISEENEKRLALETSITEEYQKRLQAAQAFIKDTRRDEEKELILQEKSLAAIKERIAEKEKETGLTRQMAATLTAELALLGPGAKSSKAAEIYKKEAVDALNELYKQEINAEVGLAAVRKANAEAANKASEQKFVKEVGLASKQYEAEKSHHVEMNKLAEEAWNKLVKRKSDERQADIDHQRQLNKMASEAWEKSVKDQADLMAWEKEQRRKSNAEGWDSFVKDVGLDAERYKWERETNFGKNPELFGRSIASIASITGNRGGLDELYDRLAKGSEKDEATKAIEKQTKDIEEGNELQREGNRVLNQQNDILRGLKPGGQAVWGP